MVREQGTTDGFSQSGLHAWVWSESGNRELASSWSAVHGTQLLDVSTSTG